MRRDATAVPGIDPVTFEVLRLGLDAIADEMAYTIVRSARSTMIKDCMDYSASLCTAHGDLIAQAVNIPVMMCSTPATASSSRTPTKAARIFRTSSCSSRSSGRGD